jgi:RNA polymerase sigma-70 factor (ECF subfamily)
LVWSDQEIVNSIKDGQEEGLVYLYRTLRGEFVKWATKQFSIDADLGSDAFQEAILALRFNISHERLTEMTSSLKTYLFTIGRNQILNRLKKNKYEFSTDDLTNYQNENLVIRGQKEQLSNEQEKVRLLIEKMQEPCFSILKMFYYLGYSMEVIATRMSYKNENVAKSQKLRCINKLKQTWHH